MAQKTVDVEVSAIYSFTYDPDSYYFKEALRCFRSHIDAGGNEDSLIAHVTKSLVLNATQFNPIEGVGYIHKEGWEKPKFHFSGITVEDDDPDFNYEVLENYDPGLVTSEGNYTSQNHTS